MNVSTITYTNTKTPARTRKNSTTTQFSTPNRTPPPRFLKARKNHPLRSLSPRRGWFLYIGSVQSSLAQLTTVNRSQHRRRTRILTLITQHPRCWAWGLRSRGCGYAPQYVPPPRQRVRRFPVCCRGSGMRLRQPPRPRRQQSE